MCCSVALPIGRSRILSTAREETGTGAQPAQAQAQDTPELARRVASGAAWAQAARLAEVGLAFVLTVIFVRVLGPSAYGEYTFIVSAALLWAVLLSFGQSEAFGRFVPGLLAQGAVAQVRYLVRRMITVRLLGLGMGIAALLLLGGPVGEVWACLCWGNTRRRWRFYSQDRCWSSLPWGSPMRGSIRGWWQSRGWRGN